MPLKRLLPVAFVLAAVLFTAPETQAAPSRYGARAFREAYELNAYLTFTDFGSPMELDDEGGAGFRFGYLYNPHHEIEFLFNSVTADDQVLPGETADFDHLQVAYVLNFTEKKVVPYLTAGVGMVHTGHSSPFIGSETNPILGLGGGVRFFLGRVAYARFELRRNFFDGDGEVFAKGEDLSFQEFAFGIGWRIPTR